MQNTRKVVPHSRKRMGLVDLLAQHGTDNPFWHAEHTELREHVLAHFDADATDKLWRDVSHLSCAVRKNAGPRAISHRLGFLVLKEDGPFLEVLCTRHLKIFGSRWRYLKSRSLKSPGTCPDCESASGGSATGKGGITPVTLDRELKRAGAGYRINLEVMSVTTRYTVYATCKHVETICIRPRAPDRQGSGRECGRERPHKISNLLTLIAGRETRTIRCLGPCDSSNRVRARRTSLDEAQRRIDAVSDGFEIDRDTYDSWASKCTITHSSCGQRHRMSPQYFRNYPGCLRCDARRRSACAIVPTLDDLDHWLRAVTHHELDPNRRPDNEAMFAQREELKGELKFYVRCQIHPTESSLRPIGSLRRASGTGCCRQSAAESKKKYTVRYLEEHCLPAAVTVDCKASRIADIDAPIAPTHELTLRCQLHGRVDRGFTTYKLARLRDYATTTPCLECNPQGSVRLTPSRVRMFVESSDRIRTHGALFALVSSDREIARQLQDARNNGESCSGSLTIAIKAISPHPCLCDGETVQLAYEKFAKGSVGRSSPDHSVSWLHRFVGVICRAMGIAYESEVSFPGLDNKGGNRLRVDFVFRSLGLAVEVDGPQHVSEDHQFPYPTAMTPRRIFATIKDRDNRENGYFAMSTKFTLKRLPAYQAIGARVRPLSIPESFDRALTFCKGIYRRIYGCAPAPLDREHILAGATKRAVTARRALAVESIYGGFFSYIRKELPTSTGSGARMVLQCQHGHFISIPFTTCRSHKAKLVKGGRPENICRGCTANRTLDEIESKAALVGAVLQNAEEIRAQYRGRLAAPLTGPSIGGRVLEFRHTQTGEVKSLKACVALIPGKLDAAFALPKEAAPVRPPAFKPVITNRDELHLGRQRAIEHNRSIRAGADSPPPNLPVARYNGKHPKAAPTFLRIHSHMPAAPQFTLIAKPGQVWSGHAMIGLRHSCNRISFYAATKLARLLERGEVPVCQARACFEATTGVTLGKDSFTPSRRGSQPTNKKHSIGDEVAALSGGVLRPVGEPVDVRSSFIAEFLEGPHQGRRVRVSSHDNWVRRDTYKRIALASRDNAPLPINLRLLP